MPFYAVRKGRTPGIYTSWTDCLTQVHGFSGAEFQRFTVEAVAQAWLAGDSAPATVAPASKAAPILTEPGQTRLVTDGSCCGNPGAGGCAALIYSGQSQQTITKAFRYTTNNRMELMAVIVGLEAIPEGTTVELVADSRYLINGLSAVDRQQKNTDLWQRLKALLATRIVEPRWVKGHENGIENNWADLIAVAARDVGPWEEDEGYTRLKP